MSLNHSPDLYRDTRFRVGKFACDLCGGEFPITHMMLQSGLHVGAMCCWEWNGGSVDRDLTRAMASIRAAELSAKELTPPMKDGDPYYGVEEVPAQSFVATISPNPVTLTRGGAPVAVTLVGNNFAATDTIAYGATGITNASAPVLASDLLRTLSVQASALTTISTYSFTFNGTVWPNVFDVR
jgi:hypothetical protein